MRRERVSLVSGPVQTISTVCCCHLSGRNRKDVEEVPTQVPEFRRQRFFRRTTKTLDSSAAFIIEASLLIASLYDFGVGLRSRMNLRISAMVFDKDLESL